MSDPSKEAYDPRMIFDRDKGPDQHEQLVDAAYIAALLGVTRETVYRKARTGDIPAVRVGRLYRFVIADVLEALQPAPAGSWHQSRRSTARRRGPREP